MTTSRVAKFASVSRYSPDDEVDSGSLFEDEVDDTDSTGSPSPDATVDIIEWHALGLVPEAITRISGHTQEAIDEVIEAWPELWECASEDAFNRLLRKMYSLAVGRETPKSGQLSYLQSMLGYLGSQTGLEDGPSSIIESSDAE